MLRNVIRNGKLLGDLEKMNTKELSDIISTLITNGFHIHKVERPSTNNIIINVYKIDKLGANIKYSIHFSDDMKESPVIQSLDKISNSYASYPIYVNDNLSSKDYSNYTKKSFFEIFGGMINTGLILIPKLPSVLDELGHNILPSGLKGKPDDLHELYVCECLQFILVSPTRRYGEDRLFEKLPDGIVLAKNFLTCIDSKAYKNGYEFEADDIKRFSSYVEDFNNRYSQYFGRVHSFLVISGHFNDSTESISNRSKELYRICGCTLSCIKSSELGNIVQHLQNMPEYRTSIDWKIIFSELLIELKYIEEEIKRIKKDKVF